MQDSSLNRRQTVRLGAGVAFAQIGIIGFDGQIELEALRLYGLPEDAPAILYGWARHRGGLRPGAACAAASAPGAGGWDLLAADCCAQALAASRAPRHLQFWSEATQGLGAGGNPARAREATEETADLLAPHLAGREMVILVAALGGGTGGGATPVVARLAREAGAFVLAVAALSPRFQGAQQMRASWNAQAELQDQADGVLVLPGDALFRTAGTERSFADLFGTATDRLVRTVRGVTGTLGEGATPPLHTDDIRTLMGRRGRGAVGFGLAEGTDRATRAVAAALADPLLAAAPRHRARGVLAAITAGPGLRLLEIDELVRALRAQLAVVGEVVPAIRLDASVGDQLGLALYVLDGAPPTVTPRPDPEPGPPAPFDGAAAMRQARTGWHEPAVPTERRRSGTEGRVAAWVPA